jgi:hypothetical protein
VPIVLLLELCWWHVTDWPEVSPVVQPVDPDQHVVLGRIKGSPPWPSSPHQFGLEQPDDSLGQHVVVRVAGRADRGVNTSFTQRFAVADTGEDQDAV